MPSMLFTALQRYAQFAGRARRKEYWHFQLLNIIVTIVAGIIDSVLGMKIAADTGPFGVLASLALFVPGLAVAWRRLHDVDKPGWFNLVPLAGVAIVVAALAQAGGPDLAAISGGSFPTLGWVGVALAVGFGIILFILAITEGTRGPNQYGPDPKGVANNTDDRVIFR